MFVFQYGLGRHDSENSSERNFNDSILQCFLTRGSRDPFMYTLILSIPLNTKTCEKTNSRMTADPSKTN